MVGRPFRELGGSPSLRRPTPRAHGGAASLEVGAPGEIGCPRRLVRTPHPASPNGASRVAQVSQLGHDPGRTRRDRNRRLFEAVANASSAPADSPGGACRACRSDFTGPGPGPLCRTVPPMPVCPHKDRLPQGRWLRVLPRDSSEQGSPPLQGDQGQVQGHRVLGSRIGQARLERGPPHVASAGEPERLHAKPSPRRVGRAVSGRSPQSGLATPRCRGEEAR
mmetsp:Transcript_161794/g.519015  ORF Transcript_161794/g.519015 Transcript_161794/m.519015 type:complete len:222 (+) Transcript_161794:457-1122(+)